MQEEEEKGGGGGGGGEGGRGGRRAGEGEDGRRGGVKRVSRKKEIPIIPSAPQVSLFLSASHVPSLLPPRSLSLSLSSRFLSTTDCWKIYSFLFFFFFFLSLHTQYLSHYDPIFAFTMLLILFWKRYKDTLSVQNPIYKLLRLNQPEFSALFIIFGYYTLNHSTTLKDLMVQRRIYIKRQIIIINVSTTVIFINVEANHRN